MKKRMIEEAFAEVDRLSEQLQRHAKNFTGAARKASSYSATGDLAKLKQAIEGAQSAVAEAKAVLEDLRRTVHEIEEVRSAKADSLSDEFRAACAELGLKLQQTDVPGNFVAFPVTVSFVRGQVAFDRKTQQSARPSALAKRLETLTKRSAPNLTTILRKVYKAARYLHRETSSTKEPSVIECKAADIFELLSLNNPEYDHLSFLYELYLLDRNVNNEVNGYRLSFPASTGTRSKHAFTIYGPEGYPHVYYALRFERITGA